MFETLARRAKAVFGPLPLAGRLRHFRQEPRADRAPDAGSRAAIEAWLGDLLVREGADRLPAGTRLPWLAEWLEALYEGKCPEPPQETRRVLVFGLLPYWVDFCLPIAVVLAARNCEVDYAWLPYTLMDRPEPEYPAGEKRTRLFPFVQLHPNLRLCNLLHIERQNPTEEMTRIATRFAELDTQYALRRELVDLRAGNGKAVHELRLQRNLDALGRLARLLRWRKYDSLLIPNGGIYELGALYRMAQGQGTPSVTVDFAERKGHLVISQACPAVEYDTEDLWKADEPHVLSPENEREIQEVLCRRESPNWEAADYTWAGQPVPVEPGDRLRTELGLAPDKPVVLMCTNIAHDAAVLGRMRTFTSMAEWILETVGWFARHTDWQLVVRCHPGESLSPSDEPAPELIAARFPNLPDTIKIIKPTDRVNTYGLMRICHFGLVYTTTVGLEMACRGIPIIVGGLVHYTGKGFTTDPTGPAEYFQALERATAESAPARLTPRQVQLATAYAHLYFRRLPQPFPWAAILDPESNMRAWPVRRVLSGDCPPSFLETFDCLAGRSSNSTTGRRGGNWGGRWVESLDLMKRFVRSAFAGVAGPAAVQPPSLIKDFPKDLHQTNLKPVGIFEDGWTAGTCSCLLAQSAPGQLLVVRGHLPGSDDPNARTELTVLVDGTEVVRRVLDFGDFEVRGSGGGAEGTRHVTLKFDRTRKLPQPDGREVGAQLLEVSFRTIKALVGARLS